MRYSADPTLEAEITRLADLGLNELRQLWNDRIGRVPTHQSLSLLRCRLAYELQAKAYGGLKLQTRRRLRQLYKAFRSRPKFTPLRNRDLKPGSVLNREWKGEVHSVQVLVQGFEYLGQRYESLSEVAAAITGSKRSGPEFFGFSD